MESITCSDIFKTFVSSVRLERQLRTLHRVISFIVYSRLRYNTRDDVVNELFAQRCI